MIRPTQCTLCTLCKCPRTHIGSYGQLHLGLSHRLVSFIGSWSPQNYDKSGVAISYPVENGPAKLNTPESEKGLSGRRMLINDVGRPFFHKRP